ncbi:MAG: carotenoid biosynthesis protein [Xanthobacteraceae bacterium]
MSDALIRRSLPSQAIGKYSLRVRQATIWALIAIYLALVIRFAWNPTPLAQALAAIGIASAFAHASLTYGWKDALAFLGICLVITFSIENIGVATGLPFGRYHFEVGTKLPHIGAIPIIVGPLWFGMGYFSWVVAETLLGGAGRRLNERFDIVSLPIVAAFAMTQWDLVMDPPTSTLSKAWIWHDGGADFGVPLSNYLGWFLTSWLFFQAFAIHLRHRRDAPVQARKQNFALRLAAILFYISSGLTHLTPWLLLEQRGEIADAAGHIWDVHDLRETTVVVMVFTMLFASVLAALRLASDTLAR